MKKINSLILLVLLSVSTGNMQADVNAAPAVTTTTTTTTTDMAHQQPSGSVISPFAATSKPQVSADDTTKAFFIALSKCTPGMYQEKNLLSATVGPELLNHKINGVDKDVCAVSIGTPDGRSMSCNFKISDLSPLAEPHFISGILADSLDDPSDKAVRAAQVWSDLKSTNCSF